MENFDFETHQRYIEPRVNLLTDKQRDEMTNLMSEAAFDAMNEYLNEVTGQ